MYDLAILGGGPGGYVAAIRGAQQGLKVALVERDTLGGTCLNKGCIPTKSLFYDSKLFRTAKNSSILRGNEGLFVDPAKLLGRKRKVVATQVNGLEKLVKSNGIELIQGYGELLSPRQINITENSKPVQTLEARNVILAMGSRPAVPSFIDVDGAFVQTTDQALDTEDIPKEIVIIGGGVIGIEMATIYLNLGSKVTIIEMLSDILITEDKDIRQIMLKLLSHRGASVHLNARVKEIKLEKDGITVIFEDREKTLVRNQTPRVLVATGRAPVLDGIVPEKLGLAMDGPFVKVNERLVTNIPGVFAIGDIVGGMMLAHKATAEAETAIYNIIGQRKKIDPWLIPRCIWGLEEIGAVGLNEDQARSARSSIKVGKFSFTGSGAAQAMGNANGLVKIIGDAETGEILGTHIIGEHATDLISEAVTAMKMEGAVEDLYEAIKPHPTISETIKEAALDWAGMPLHAIKKS
jgi:dihydrolipoamide dehydrogenase